MLGLLTQRLAIYTYSDATPDGGYDNATYTFSTYAWGRIEPAAAASDQLTAEAARVHRTATITFRDSTSVPAGAIVKDPVSQDQWRVRGPRPLQRLRCVQYSADWVPQFTLTSTAFGP